MGIYVIMMIDDYDKIGEVVIVFYSKFTICKFINQLISHTKVDV